MIVTLIGYRGSGKSSVAAPLAARLGWDWLDADVELERRAGRSIREIFADEGEPFFRILERDLLAELLDGDRLVLAAGGGAVLDAPTQDRMQRSGPVVWLRASVGTVQSRIAADASTTQRRPALTAQGGRLEIEHLLSQREPLYRQCATLIVDTDRRSVAQVVDQIIASLPTPPHPER